jgi:heat shock protein HtpX
MTRPPTWALLASPSVTFAVVVAALLLVVGLPVWLAAAAALVVAGALALALHRRAPAVALDTLGAEAIEPGTEPRLANVVEGLCATSGNPLPRLYRVEADALNAAILGRSADDVCLVVTTGLLAALDRLELEAVVARLLSQLKRGVEPATVLVSVARLATPLGLRDRILGWALDRRSMMAVDLDAVRLTRFPPALASAYEKSAAVRPIESNPVVDHLWLLGTTSGRLRGVAHPPLTDRIDILREL